jgi:hypothetical protein
MLHSFKKKPFLGPKRLMMAGLILIVGLAFIIIQLNQSSSGPPPAQASFASPAAVTAGQPSKEPGAVKAALPAVTPIPTFTASPTPSPTATPTLSPTPTVTPTPTRDLASCHALGCGPTLEPVPTLAYDFNLLMTSATPKRRRCTLCPKNEILSQAELDDLVGADPATLEELLAVALSQQPYKIAPGIVYVVSDYVHHVVVDLREQGYKFRNIIPPIPDLETQEKIRITPSYCMTPETLVVTTGDYHGLVGSNKTESGRELFFHLGRAAFFLRKNRYDIDVITQHSAFARTTVSWGGGPLFIFNGKYDFNPKQEWFDEDNLEHYRTTRWTKITVAISQDRRYLFLSSSYGLTIEEHAQNIIELGQRWGIKVDRAMRFDGSESAYLAIRFGPYLVPLLNLEEPLIVNCLAIEKSAAPHP